MEPIRLEYRNMIPVSPPGRFSRLAIGSLIFSVVAVFTTFAWLHPFRAPLLVVQTPAALLIPTFSLCSGVAALFRVIDSGLVRGVGLALIGLLLSFIMSFIVWTVYLM
jgi:hypothetical protein